MISLIFLNPFEFFENILTFLLPYKGSSVIMKTNSRFSCQDTQNDVKRPE